MEENTTNTPNERLREPWPAGVSGNPNGRPKGSRNRSTIVREILELQHSSGQTYEYASTKAVAEKAAQGDVQAWEKLMDSAHGKLTDKQELTGAGGAPLQGIIRTVVDPKGNDNPTN